MRRSLVLILSTAFALILGADAVYSSVPGLRVEPGGQTLELQWASSDSEREAWLAPPPEGLPGVSPEVSLKVALPSGQARVAVHLLDASWVRASQKGTTVSGGPVLLGTQGEWKGIPYQEILLRPLREAADGEGGVELLASATLLVELETPEFRFADPDRLPALGGDASLFVNPTDARVLPPAPEAAPLPEAPRVAPLPGLRIRVSSDGVVRADYAWLTAHGFDPTGLDPRKFTLTCQGLELPIWVEGQEDGVFGPGDAVVFYGQRAALPARSYWNGGDFTDTNIYWLRGGSTTGSRMAAVPAAPVSGFPSVTTFTATVRAEQDTFMDAVDHLRPNGSIWYWGPPFGTGAGGSASVRSLTLPAPGAVSGTVQVVLVTAGLGPGLHSVSPRLNAAAPTAGGDPWSWSDRALTEATWTFHSLAAGDNVLQLTVPGFADHADYQVPDYVLLTYGRSLESDSGALLLTPPNASSTYSSPGYSAAPYLLDLSRSDAATGLFLPRRLTGASFSGGVVTFEMASDAGVSGRRVALSDSPALPDGAEAGTPQDLTGADAGADLLVITHSDFAPAAPSSSWQQWLSRRSAGLSVRVVTAQEVFDNFASGLFDPPALRTFLQTVGTSWTLKPRWVLLVGDGTWDYENRWATAGFQNTVPTMAIEDLDDSTYLGRYNSDAWFADWNGDGYPDAAVGRLPAHSAAESEGLFAKLLAYEDQALSGTWYKTATFVADKTDGYGQNFEIYLNGLASSWTGSPWSTQKLYYGQSPYGGTDSARFATDLRAAFPTSALMIYSGHGFFTWWGYEGGATSLFTSTLVRNGNTQSDVDLLTASTHLPFLLQGTCYSSAFAEPSAPALAEELLVRSDRGTIGSAGQTTIGYFFEEQLFSDALFQQAFGSAKVRRAGDLIEAGRFALPSTDPRAVFGNVLLGDPSLALRLPAPPAPPTLQAVGLNAAVSLAWTAATPTPAGYRLYRSENGGATWSLHPASPLPAGQTAYTDSGRTNTVTYHYYLTSFDGAGFEGPPGPVASATPLNPDPPAVPAGFSATDSGLGDAVDILWTANTEPDLARYTLWWGTASGVYPNSEEQLKGATSRRLRGLTPGTPYYFTLTASNTSGRTSAYAPEVCATPSSPPLAIRPPAMIADLHVTRSGNDLILTWTKPSVDVGGRPLEGTSAVDHFHLYRVVGSYSWNLDTVSQSAPNARVTIPATSEVSYTYIDVGASALGSPVTYLVVAFAGTSGERSPASTLPPAPVLGLRVRRSATSGKTLLSFNPVSTVCDGSAPAQVDHYTVYGFFPVSASSDHVRPSSPALTATVLASLPVDPGCEGALVCDSAAAPLFYTVVAVDRRGNTSLY